MLENLFHNYRHVNYGLLGANLDSLGLLLGASLESLVANRDLLEGTVIDLAHNSTFFRPRALDSYSPPHIRSGF